MTFGKFDRERAALDVLLKQYEFLRDEITRCIYLEHIAILGLYTFLGLVTASLIGRLFLDSSNSHFSYESTFFLLALVFAQVIICGFGSLFLKEQARNRRACSFLKASEDLINEKIGEIGIYWENYIVSDLIKKYPINPQYYMHRLGGVGLPVFLPNLLITSAIFYIFYGRINIVLFVFIIPLAVIISLSILTLLDILTSLKLPTLLDIILRILATAFLFFIFYGKCNFFLLLSFIISVLITSTWALRIALRTYSPLVKEKMPKKLEILEWLEEEQSKILSRNLFSFFTLKNNKVDLYIHVIKKGYSGVIYDIEISLGDQKPPWVNVKCIADVDPPTGWHSRMIGRGVRFCTKSSSLIKDEPLKFRFEVQPEITDHTEIYSIRVHLSDQNGKNLGEIISWRVVSSFTLEDGTVVMKVHEVRERLDKKVYSIEISPKDQDLPWESFEGIEFGELPKCWNYKKINSGVKFFTKSNPLRKCESTTFKFKVQPEVPEELCSFIKLVFKDKDGKTIEKAISTRQKNLW